MSSLSKNIQENRKNQGLSQEKVAELVGVSRQAVTKWESGQSAPSTENLIRLAEIYNTTVEQLLNASDTKLHQVDMKILPINLKKNIKIAIYTVIGYLTIYLLGRIFANTCNNCSAIQWLFGSEPQQLSYLYGWLIHQKLFWIAMIISTIPSLFGKYLFSLTTSCAFSIGLLLGEWLGDNPYANSCNNQYGWLIWLLIFLFSILMGSIIETFSKEELTLKSRKFNIWLILFMGGIVTILLSVILNFPTY